MSSDGKDNREKQSSIKDTWFSEAVAFLHSDEGQNLETVTSGQRPEVVRPPPRGHLRGSVQAKGTLA